MAGMDGRLLEREVEGVLARLSQAAAVREETRDSCDDREERAYNDGACAGLQVAWSWLSDSLEQARRVSELRLGGRR